MLQVFMHRHLPGLTNFIASVQVLVSWFMSSPMGNWGALAVCSQKLFHNSTSIYSNYVALLCPVHRQTHALSTTPFLCIVSCIVSLGAGLICWLKKTRLIPSSSELSERAQEHT